MITFNENQVKQLVEYYFKDNNYSKDIVKKIGITKEQAKNGTVIDVVVNRASPKVNSKEFIFNEELEKVTIPRNSKENTIIELKEKGNKYTTDESRGNLYVKIHIFGK